MKVRGVSDLIWADHEDDGTRHLAKCNAGDLSGFLEPDPRLTPLYGNSYTRGGAIGFLILAFGTASHRSLQVSALPVWRLPRSQHVGFSFLLGPR
jgi:hypothetical protein